MRKIFGLILLYSGPKISTVIFKEKLRKRMTTFGERKQLVYVIDILKITRSSIPEKL